MGNSILFQAIFLLLSQNNCHAGLKIKLSHRESKPKQWLWAYFGLIAKFCEGQDKVTFANKGGRNRDK